MTQEDKAICFIGANSYSDGIGRVDTDYMIKFKIIGKLFRKIRSIGRRKEAMKYLWLDLPEYDPTTDEMTGKTKRFVFTDLDKGQEFCFKGNVPSSFKIHYQAMESKLNAYQNEFTKILEVLDTLTIDDFDRRRIEESIKFSRSVTNNFQGQAPQKQ